MYLFTMGELLHNLFPFRMKMHPNFCSIGGSLWGCLEYMHCRSCCAHWCVAAYRWSVLDMGELGLLSSPDDVGSSVSSVETYWLSSTHVQNARTMLLPLSVRMTLTRSGRILTTHQEFGTLTVQSCHQCVVMEVDKLLGSYSVGSSPSLKEMCSDTQIWWRQTFLSNFLQHCVHF